MKFQTGFDQPLLHTMYVDRNLGGVNAVQTLSRLNRIHPPLKQDTAVLDFANEAEDIKAAFTPYYDRTELAEATDPNQLYSHMYDLQDAGVYEPADATAFRRSFLRRRHSTRATPATPNETDHSLPGDGNRPTA